MSAQSKTIPYERNIQEFCSTEPLQFNLSYHLYTLHLFTASDLKTILIPETFFAISSVLSGSLLLTKNSSQPVTEIVTRIPLVALWIWINLLPFNISNQRRPSAVLEDRTNKPWRPIPSERISARDAKWLMVALYAAALAVSVFLDCLVPSVTLIVLGCTYNDLGGADYSCVIRNLINAAGFTCFASGATMVASGHDAALNGKAYLWFLLIVAIVASTVQMQDIPDQEGDNARGRKTVPLVIGDEEARWTVAAPVAFWSFIAPSFWNVSLLGFAAPLVLGMVIVERVFSQRSRTEDKRTFKVWNMWMMSLYLLPLVKRLGC